jgi:hypothetical protein
MNPITKTIVVAALTLLVSLALPVLSPASRASDLLGIIGGESIDDATKKFNYRLNDTLAKFLTDIEVKSTDLLTKGTNSTSLITVHAGNEMAILAATVRSQFGDEVNKQIRYTSVELKPILIQLQRWQDSVGQLSDTLITLEDMLALDMEDKLPFGVHLAVRRIKGGLVIQNDPATYMIDLIGPNFGADPAGVTTTFDLRLNGVALDPPDRKPPFDAVFSIKKETIKDLFKQDQLVTIPLLITITRTEPRFLHVLGDKMQKLTLPYKISLLPEYAGKVTVTSEYLDFDWLPANNPIHSPTFTVSGEEARVGKVYGTSIPNAPINDRPKPGDMRIVRDSLDVKCIADIQPALQFPNGKTYPRLCIRSGTDDWNVFERGFVSPRYIGGGGDQGESYNSVNNDFFARFGFRLGRAWSGPIFGSKRDSPPFLESRCAENGHCTLMPEELFTRATATTMDVTACSRMEWKPVETGWEQQDTKVTVWIRRKIGAPGADDTCKLSTNATWAVSYKTLAYRAKPDLITSPEQAYPVYIGIPVPIGVLNRTGNVKAKLIFDPIVGKPVNRNIPDDINENFRSGSP